jgi:hypothetical protein
MFTFTYSILKHANENGIRQIDYKFYNGQKFNQQNNHHHNSDEIVLDDEDLENGGGGDDDYDNELDEPRVPPNMDDDLNDEDNLDDDGIDYDEDEAAGDYANSGGPNPDEFVDEDEENDEGGGGGVDEDEGDENGQGDEDEDFFNERQQMNGGAIQQSSRYQCKFCAFVAKNHAKLQLHLATHYNLKPFMCPICKRRANFKWDIQKHLRKIHNDFTSEVHTYITNISSHLKSRNTTYF